jgi:hypothetical protein
MSDTPTDSITWAQAARELDPDHPDQAANVLARALTYRRHYRSGRDEIWWFRRDLAEILLLLDMEGRKP